MAAAPLMGSQDPPQTPSAKQAGEMGHLREKLSVSK